MTGPVMLGEIGGAVATLDDRGGDTLYVAFGYHGWAYRKMPDFWGEKFFRKHGASSLGVTDAGSNWFPEKHVRPLIDRVRAAGVLDRYDRIVTYGGSMGGYGALKYASQLGAAAAVVMAPQVSIDLRDTAHYDRRYRRHWSEDLHPAMMVTTADLPPHSYAVYDPLYAPDRGHVEILRSLGPTTELLATGSQHAPLSVLTETGRAWAVIQLLLSQAPDSRRQAHAVYRQARHESWTYFRRIGDYLLERGRRAQALAAYERSKALHAASDYGPDHHVDQRLEELRAG